MQARGTISRRGPTSGRYADALLALLLLSIVGMMIIPMPTFLLDILIASNVALSLLMLLIALAIHDGLGFAAMPTILLVTTLYRLALNVSSTRLILLQADAGEVIRSFGEFVVRGNYLVGAVVFAILTLIQYVVIARGSERVAEVGARFSLDAMPGKQMAIDADLRAGALTPQAARARRRDLDRENQFYGAMDGAMKFVKGDAIAGIAITVINIAAGVAIGVATRDMSAQDSLQLYGLLTIGDGLVSQIPSLLVSTSAGLVVTRVAASDGASSLGRDIASQLFAEPRVLLMGAGFLALVALLPGLPFVPFAILSALLIAVTVALSRGTRARIPLDMAAPLQPLPVLAIELGQELSAPLLSEGGALHQPLALARTSVEQRLGLPLPDIELSAEHSLPGRAYRLRLHGVALAADTADPADAHTAIARAFERLVTSHADELIGIEETQRLLDQLEERAPALVRNTVPDPIPLKRLCDVLKRLLRERVSIRSLREILQALSSAQPGADLDTLVDTARRALSRQITDSLAQEGTLRAHPIDPTVEDLLRDAVMQSEQGSFLALRPDEARELIAAARALEPSADPARPLVLISQPDIRRFVHDLLQSDLPDTSVLSYPEVDPMAKVDMQAPLRIGH